VASAPNGEAHVYLRSIDDLNLRDLGYGRSPFFSPDGKSLAYSDDEAAILMANYLAWEFMRVEPMRHISVQRREATRSRRRGR